MKIWLLKLTNPGIQCDGPECQHLSEYFNMIMRDIYHIKLGTIVAIIEIDGMTEFYCTACIDGLYQYMRSKLDRKLWAFH